MTGQPVSPLVDALDEWHTRSAKDPIGWPDVQGAFGPTVLPFVFPVVVDANVLRDELLRMARTGQRTILANAVNSGVLRLFCAAHVVDEVDEHFSEWAEEKGLDPAEVQRVWESTYLPLLRCVDVPDGLTAPAETERLAVLGDALSQYGDPDDVPTATLALLLGAPLLSKDKNALRAVYGDAFDYDRHVNWLDALRAGGDLGPLGSLIQVSSMFIAGLGVGSYRGIKALARQVPWSWLLFGSVVSVSVVNHLLPEVRKQHVLSVAGNVLGFAGRAFAEVSALHSAARTQFEALSPAPPQWADPPATLGTEATLERACLHTLARSPNGDLSAAELSQRIGADAEVSSGEAKVRTTLRGHACFDQPYRGRFQVGSALALAPG